MASRHYIVVLTAAEHAAVMRALSFMNHPTDDESSRTTAMSHKAQEKIRNAAAWAPIRRGFREAISVATAGEEETSGQFDRIDPADRWLDGQPR